MKPTLEQRLRRIEEKVSQKNSTSKRNLNEDYNVDNINKRIIARMISDYHEELEYLISVKIKYGEKEFGIGSEAYSRFEEQLRGETLRVFNRLIQDTPNNRLN